MSTSSRHRKHQYTLAHYLENILNVASEEFFFEIYEFIYSSFISKESEYTIDDDDKYYVGFTNTNSKSIILTVHLNVSSKMYDTSKATSVCSAVHGSCRLQLAFPSPKYITVSTLNDVSYLPYPL
ncbi:hypothetical protein QQ045_021623 [Rhodiola kirilowii]